MLHAKQMYICMSYFCAFFRDWDRARLLHWVLHWQAGRQRLWARRLGLHANFVNCQMCPEVLCARLQVCWTAGVCRWLSLRRHYFIKILHFRMLDRNVTPTFFFGMIAFMTLCRCIYGWKKSFLCLIVTRKKCLIYQ